MGSGRTRLQNRLLLFRVPLRYSTLYRLVLVFRAGQAESVLASPGSWATGRIASRARILRSDDTVIHLRPVCGNRDAGLLRSRSAEPLVHFGLCGSLRPRLRLRISARRVAVRDRGGGLVSSGPKALVDGAAKLFGRSAV